MFALGSNIRAKIVTGPTRNYEENRPRALRWLPGADYFPGAAASAGMPRPFCYTSGMVLEIQESMRVVDLGWVGSRL